ncbi:poly-beta-hydroxybutyrate-responsive repressor [Calidifontibacillus oryziterrae]|uniref:poly-beta-hydroxybutyrate-responsive repressor n=1 Tax=Calidifontibacillus oryziterrae TaxID=1191699 RepID=UPI00037D4840|nr:poly-beta-hydroxybutyrate-responsive repressor [Calidifontibacillus oryziterrae]
MSKHTKSSTSESDHPFQAPRNFIIPFVLLSLRDLNLHGYKIMQQLIDFGFSTIDQGNLYRMLRQLEREEMVQSKWDTSETGPAKRIYSLTEVGEKYLSTCVSSLEQYQLLINRFFNMYTDMFMIQTTKNGWEDKT